MHSNGDKQSRPRAAAYKTATGARAQLHQVSRAMELLGKFRRVARGASVLIGPTNHSAIVGGAQLWALCEIQAHPGIKVSDLATTMALHQSTVSNLLDKLLSKRLVRRQRDTVDARVVHLSVTAAGAREIGRPRFSKRSVLLESLERLPSSKFEQLDRDLENLLRRMRAPKPVRKRMTRLNRF